MPGRAARVVALAHVEPGPEKQRRMRAALPRGAEIRGGAAVARLVPAVLEVALDEREHVMHRAAVLPPRTCPPSAAVALSCGPRNYTSRGE